MPDQGSATGGQVWECPFRHDEALDFDPLMLRLLTEAPIARIRMNHGTEEAWLATRHRDVRVVTTDRRFSRAAGAGRDLPRMTPEPIAHPDSLNLMDPPSHTRLRRAIAQGFTRKAVERLEPRIGVLADELLDEMVEAGPRADLVRHFSAKLPMLVMGEMFGIPESDRSWLRERTVAIMAVAPGRGAASAKTELREYFDDLVDSRRRKPGDDLLSAMSEASGVDEPLTDAELAMLAQVLVVAGHDTQIYETSNIAYLLLTREPLRAELAARPESLPGAIEEMLRFIPFRQGVGIARVATEDVDLSGTTIRAGEAVHVSYLTANRDEEVFPRPDELDIGRASNPHMTFGHGTHRCPGARLARTQLHVSIGALLKRFPGLRLAVDPTAVEWNTASIWRFPLALPVSW